MAAQKHGNKESKAAAAGVARDEVVTPDTNPDSISNAEGVVDISSADPIVKLQAEKQEMMNTLVRRQADFENFKKRVEKEKHQDRQRGIEVMIEQMLPVLDAFDRALAGPVAGGNADYRKGFEMIRAQMWNGLAKQGLMRIDTEGKEFDPNLHHAIESVPGTEHAEGIVVGEMQPGYVFNGRVLRPAMVRVSAGRTN
ncbi:MAG TPA: nucleotide exchange factor GrpE [Candidatus Acidoferrales bacterium]